jgi:hypothetical protein
MMHLQVNNPHVFVPYQTLLMPFCGPFILDFSGDLSHFSRRPLQSPGLGHAQEDDVYVVFLTAMARSASHTLAISRGGQAIGSAHLLTSQNVAGILEGVGRSDEDV